jgi:hypothetical protein
VRQPTLTRRLQVCWRPSLLAIPSSPPYSRTNHTLVRDAATASHMTLLDFGGRNTKPVTRDVPLRSEVDGGMGEKETR